MSGKDILGASPQQRGSASFDFVEFRHDSAIQASLMALAAPSFRFADSAPFAWHFIFIFILL